MNEILSAVLVVGGLGLVLGCLLAYAYSVFYVPTDTRVEKIVEVLPGANCGACGYAGCSAYAESVVAGKAPVNACSVGKMAVAQSIATIMGVKADEKAEFVARVHCAGDCDSSLKKYNYMGVPDCIAMSRIAGGAKDCMHGCLGLGTCVSVCKFDAISIVDGVAVIDPEKCTGCGSCIKHCPKQVIALAPKESTVFIKCSSPDKGAIANKKCTKACIGCKLCEKNCPNDAIKVENNLAIIDYTKCVNCGICVEKCPKHALVTI